MDKVTLKIDGTTVNAPVGSTILEAAESVGIKIPNMCHVKHLKPYGACRFCLVELDMGSWKKQVASCVYQVKEGLVVETNSPQVQKMREMLVELIWPLSQDVASEFNIKVKSRFRTESPDCHLCGICVRHCAEVRKNYSVYFKGRGVDRKIAFVEGMEKECNYCQECFGFCKGSKIIQEIDRVYE